MASTKEAMPLDEEDDYEEEEDSDDESEEEEEDGKTSKVFSEQTRTLGFSGVPTALERDMYIDDLESDDEDDAMNKTGRVPLHWYEGYDHIGYDLTGSKVVGEGESSFLDAALRESSMMTVYDKLNGREVTLTPREALLIRRIKAGAFANPESEMYPDLVDYVSSKKEISGLYKDQYEPKRRFIPSKHEKARVYRIVEGLKSGRIKTKATLEEERQQREDPERIFLNFAASLWTDDDQDDGKKKGPPHLPAPKLALPGHEESYRPPEEYLPDNEEDDDEEKSFVPKRHDVMRHVGAYPKLVEERFERCLDLYLCPRGLKRKLNIDPESLVPKLPDPSDLKPFPNALCRTFSTDDNAPAITGVGVSPDGQFVATADDSGLLIVWETLTARRLSDRRLFTPGRTDACSDLAWNPNPSHHVLAAACVDRVVFASSGTARGDDKDITAALLTVSSQTDSPDFVTWEQHGEDRLDAVLRHTARTIAWHRKGDYAVSVSPSAPPSRQVIVHRCSTSSSQAPLRSQKTASGDAVQSAKFHPEKPFLFVATKTTVKIFHLTQQKLVKTLLTGCKWISDLDIHPTGDHVLLGSCDKRISWFDLDLGTKPFKTLRYHTKAIRRARYHPRYPLFASCGDDSDIFVLHATVYASLMKNPRILPVHIFKAPHRSQSHSGGVLCLDFHPSQPWLFSGGRDGILRLFHSL